MDGVPLIIDFNERKSRARPRGCRAALAARAASPWSSLVVVVLIARARRRLVVEPRPPDARGAARAGRRAGLRPPVDRPRPRGDERALTLAAALPELRARCATRCCARLQDPACGDATVRKQRGDEAALALLNTQHGDRGLARARRHRQGPQGAPRPQACGAGLADLRRPLPGDRPARESLTAARALAQAGSEGASLARDPDLREGDVAACRPTAWPTAGRRRDGVRRLLAPQGGLLGAAGRPARPAGAKGAAFGLARTTTGARIVVRSELDPKVQAAPRTFKPFTPTLHERRPRARWPTWA